jgi:hypothetical protein
VKTPANVTWTASGSGGTMNSNGVLSSDASLAADSTVTITAIYSENGNTRTATLTVSVKAVSVSACSGSSSNQSALTINGGSNKKYGDALDVDYCLKNFNPAAYYDLYIALLLPDGTMLFLQSPGFFGTPTFGGQATPYLANTLISDKSGRILSLPILSASLPSGSYTFYAITVPTGKSVFNGFNWIGTMQQQTFTLGK